MTAASLSCDRRQKLDKLSCFDIFRFGIFLPDSGLMEPEVNIQNRYWYRFRHHLYLKPETCQDTGYIYFLKTRMHTSVWPMNLSCPQSDPSTSGHKGNFLQNQTVQFLSL